jgi:4'-phosphopantetheinyl transferase
VQPIYPMQCLALPESVPCGTEVWLLELDLREPVSDSDLALLSEDERIRALRFRQHQDRVRSAVTRAALRRLLSGRVMTPPEELRFVVSRFGKPQLYDEPGIEFNVSHSGCFALIALSTSGQVGVDIEYRDRAIDAKSLAAYVFSDRERQSAPQTAKDFIALWVAKESVLKALGLGIPDHLQAVSVLPSDGEGYEIAHNHPEWTGIKAWSLSVPGGYAAALALQPTKPPLAEGCPEHV